MIDTGRHTFSVDWLQSFMHDINRIGSFNTIHLTLTNDQRFYMNSLDDDKWKMLMDFIKEGI